MFSSIFFIYLLYTMHDFILFTLIESEFFV